MSGKLASLMAAPARKEAVVGGCHAEDVRPLQHQHADADEQPPLALEGVAAIDAKSRNRPRSDRVQRGKSQDD